jgi:hypothetical protein
MDESFAMPWGNKYQLLDYLLFKEYVLFSYDTILWDIVLVAVSEQGVNNIIEDISKITDIRIESFMMSDHIIKLNLSDKFDFVITILYTKVQKLLDEEFVSNIIEQYQNYYDGEKIYYTSSSRQCMLTKKINKVLKINIETCRKIIEALKNDYKFSVDFWKLNSNQIDSNHFTEKYGNENDKHMFVPLFGIKFKFDSSTRYNPLFINHFPSVQEIKDKTKSLNNLQPESLNNLQINSLDKSSNLQPDIFQSRHPMYNYNYFCKVTILRKKDTVKFIFENKNVQELIKEVFLKNPITKMPF